MDERVYGTTTRGGTANFQHFALHLMKYVGEIAAIAEHADHKEADKREKAARLAAAFFATDRPKDIAFCLQQALEDINRIADGD